MARSFEELRKKLPLKSQKLAAARTQDLLQEMALHELRRALQLSQEDMADTLHLKQSTISKMERNTDILISTLRRYLKAMGGRLVIKAEFPGGEVEINQFQEIEGLGEGE